jgi:GrpB-like predicted nucleotidyltransferase (UPF0157 family)
MEGFSYGRTLLPGTCYAEKLSRITYRCAGTQNLSKDKTVDDVVIVEYDPAWPDLFVQEAERVRAVLGEDQVVAIEHFGSTAVPGLAAKPILDLLIEVRSLEVARQAVPALAALGYAFWHDNPDQDRLFFVRGLPPRGPRTHHLHIVEPGSPLWKRLLFRDYLRLNPEERTRYAALKRDLAARFPTDRDGYTQAKTAYIEQVMQKADPPQNAAVSPRSVLLSSENSDQ